MQVALPMFLVLVLVTVPTYFTLSEVRIWDLKVWVSFVVHDISWWLKGEWGESSRQCITGRTHDRWLTSHGLCGPAIIRQPLDRVHVIHRRGYGSLLRRCGSSVSPLRLDLRLCLHALAHQWEGLHKEEADTTQLRTQTEGHGQVTREREGSSCLDQRFLWVEKEEGLLQEG